MKLNNERAEFFVPDGTQIEKAIARTTRMAISAHQDDIEIMAYDGVVKCFESEDEWFFGVVVTNGAGSARSGKYADYSDEMMQVVRKKEQKKAAYTGEYGALALLDYTSAQTKDAGNTEIVEEMKKLLLAAKPEVVYTHNLADKHDTHVGVVVKIIKAFRELPKEYRPKKVYGCEVWRCLDWMMDEDKILFDVDNHPNLAASLVEVFDSQICGGKRYDLATMGRRLANATYAASHDTDESKSLSFGMDLTPLIEDDELDLCEYVSEYMNRFVNDVTSKISKLL
jgi:LmbE family N-acetylglucosaminyl deacetylase